MENPTLFFVLDTIKELSVGDAPCINATFTGIKKNLEKNYGITLSSRQLLNILQKLCDQKFIFKARRRLHDGRETLYWANPDKIEDRSVSFIKIGDNVVLAEKTVYYPHPPDFNGWKINREVANNIATTLNLVLTQPK